MEFERQSVQVTIRNQMVELFELSAGAMLSMDENTDMTVFLEACMEGVSAEAISRWPMAVTTELYAEAAKLNNLDSESGN